MNYSRDKWEAYFNFELFDLNDELELEDEDYYFVESDDELFKSEKEYWQSFDVDDDLIIQRMKVK